jgi:hypothetical protein
VSQSTSAGYLGMALLFAGIAILVDGTKYAEYRGRVRAWI